MSDINEKISSMLLKSYYEYYKKKCLDGIGCTVGLEDENNYYNWNCVIQGPNDSPYRKGIFQLKMIFPKDFPVKGPEVIFLTPIFHLNVNPVKTKEQKLGHCCLSVLNLWNPDCTIEDILVEIFALFYKQNIESPYLGYGAKNISDYKNNREEYKKKVKFFTQKYANAKYKIEDMDKWDFDM